MCSDGTRIVITSVRMGRNIFDAEGKPGEKCMTRNIQSRHLFRTSKITSPDHSSIMGSFEPCKQAHLSSISLAKLLAGNVDTVNDLLQACKGNGFFYLDFRHPSTCDILKHVDELAIIGKSFFKLSLEKKEEYSTEKYLPSRLFGYVCFVSSCLASILL